MLYYAYEFPGFLWYVAYVHILCEACVLHPRLMESDDVVAVVCTAAVIVVFFFACLNWIARGCHSMPYVSLTKLMRDTIHARSLGVLSYHLDEPVSLFFVCAYDFQSLAHPCGPETVETLDPPCSICYYWKIRIPVATPSMLHHSHDVHRLHQ